MKRKMTSSQIYMMRKRQTQALELAASKIPKPAKQEYTEVDSQKKADELVRRGFQITGKKGRKIFLAIEQ